MSSGEDLYYSATIEFMLMALSCKKGKNTISLKGLIDGVYKTKMCCFDMCCCCLFVVFFWFFGCFFFSFPFLNHAR